MRFLAALFGTTLLAITPVVAETVTAEQLFFTGFYRSITSTDAGKAIPEEVSQKFAYCMTKVVMSFVSDEDKAEIEAEYASKKEAGPELEARIYKQIVGGLTPSIASGKDILGERCPADAAEYRKYLRG